MKPPNESHLTIGALARDCRKRLPRMLARIENLAERFAGAHVVFVENGSRDGTREVLEKWSPHGIRVSMPAVPEIPIVEDGPRKSYPYVFFDSRRISKMVFLRNFCLDRIREGGRTDYVLLLDPDARDISVEGLLSSFTAAEEWDAVAANGLQIDRALGSWIYRDVYAWLDRGDERPKDYNKFGCEQRMLAERLESAGRLVPVSCAFGGMALFHSRAIFSGRYELKKTDDPIVTYECEHVSLYRSMQAAGYDRFFINPEMKYYYNDRLEHILLELEMATRRVSQWLKDRR